MKSLPKTPADDGRAQAAGGLRCHAAARLAGQPPAASGQGGELEDRRLRHELQVHQAELELQNEELRNLRAQAETAAARYTDLYDFAPVGYFTLDCEGVIAQANLTGASLLGCERGRLAGQRFGEFVAEADRTAFKAFLVQVFTDTAAPACDLALGSEGPPPRVVHLTAALAPAGRECYVVAADITQQEKAKASRRESSAQYWLLAENVTDVIWLLDVSTWRFTYVSPSVERLRGYTVAEVQQQTLAEVMTPESYQMVERLLPARLAAFAAGDDSVRSQTHEFWQLRRDGSTVPTEVVSTLVAAGHRQVTHILGVSRDITERKQAEARSRRLRDLGFLVGASADLPAALRLCLDTAILIGGMDAGGIYLAEEPSGNLRLECHVGLSADFVAGVSCLPSDSEKVRWAHKGQPFHGHAQDQVLSVPAAEAREGLQALSLLPIHHAGRLVGVLNVASHSVAEIPPAARDALETVVSLVGGLIQRMRAQQALRESESRQRAILDNIPDPTWLKDLAGRFLTVNQAWLDQFGRTWDEVDGKTIFDFVPRELASDLAQQDIAALASGEAFSLEEEMPNSRGQPEWFQTTKAPLYTADGVLRGTIGIARNITERKRAKQKLKEIETRTRKNNELLRSILESPPGVVIFSLDPQYRYTAFTVSHKETMRAIWGIEIKVGMDMLEAISRPEDREKARHNFDRALRGESFMLTEDYGDEKLLRSAWENRYAPIRADNQTIVGVAVFVTDVTERKRAELALAQVNADLEQRVRERTAEALDLYHHAPCGYHSVNPDGMVRQMNDTELGWLGYTREEVVDRLRLADLMTPESAALFEERFRAFKEHLGPASWEWNMRCKDGSTLAILVTDEAVRDEHGRYRHSRSTVMNITKRKQAEAQLRKLQSAVEQSPVVVFITDQHGVIEYVNPSFVAQTGYTAAEALGRTPRLIKSGLTSPEVYAELWRTLLAGETWRGELCNQRKNGSLYWEMTVIAPLRDNAGRPTHFVAVKEDVTERRRVAEELRQAKEAADAANRAKSAFLANMSHEIRTPMNAILGFAQLMRRDPALTAQQQQRLDTINRSGEHLIGLISDILDMAKIEAGQMRLELEDFDFHALLADVETIYRSRAEERRLRFEVQHGPGIPSGLRTDAGKVRQVLYNVLSNAVKFTARGGIRVRVVSEPAPPTATGQPAVRLCIETTDTGPGIAPEDSARVFAAFEQTAGGHHQGGGTGLGLAISQRLARELGGDLTLTSQVGAGSTFCFSFVAAVRNPASAGAVPPAAARRVIGLKLGNPPPTVLVADDTESNRQMLRAVLEMVGFVVHEADDGTSAVARCRAERPGLVLMDRRMPGLDGLAATREIRAGGEGQNARILIVSADVSEAFEEEWRSAGADGFISKPFRNEKLLLQVGALLHLECIYSAPTVAAAAPPALAPGAIAQLPAGLRADLIQATETGNGTRLRDLIAQEVALLEPALSQVLGRLAAQYDYHTLLRVLKEEEI